MIDKIKYLIRKAQQNKIVYFVSFPKSGRTWVRMFLNYYYFNCYPFSILARNRLYFDKKIPLMKFSHGGHDDYGDSSILDMEKEIKNIKNSPTIILIRDPRDVLVSYFFQLKKRIPESARKNSINNFSDIIDNKTLGFRRIIDFTNIWYSFYLNKENSLIVFYEKLKNNTDKEFKRILNFLDEEDINISALSTSIEESSFPNMKKKEQKNVSNLKYLKPGNNTDQGSFKVRKGKIGGYTDHFTEDEIEKLNTYMDALHPDMKTMYL